MLCVLPIRSFGSGLLRLAGILDGRDRAQLAQELADHVLSMALTRSDVVVVTADREVEAWGRARGVATIEDPGSGLDAAATIGIRRAAGGRWAVLHADLPYLTTDDLCGAFTLDAETVLAPTHDGGTSLIVASDPEFRFAYGAGSFRRHLSAAPAPRVVVRAGLALDLDTPADLARYRRSRGIAVHR